MSETVLVTGAAGTLGRAVVPTLLEAGFRVRAGDVREVDDASEADDLETIALDVRDAGAVRTAMDGVIAVLHGAAWHGIHLGDHPASDFWDLNATGTFNVLQGALDAGVRAVVLSSTMGVYGESRRVGDGDGAVRLHEDLPALPLEQWHDTKDTLHRYAQIVGKTRLELSPPRNHWWRVPLYVSSRGAT